MNTSTCRCPTVNENERHISFSICQPNELQLNASYSNWTRVKRVDNTFRQTTWNDMKGNFKISFLNSSIYSNSLDIIPPWNSSSCTLEIFLVSRRALPLAFLHFNQPSLRIHWRNFIHLSPLFILFFDLTISHSVLFCSLYSTHHPSSPASSAFSVLYCIRRVSVFLLKTYHLEPREACITGKDILRWKSFWN